MPDGGRGVQAPVEVDILDAQIRFQHDCTARPNLHDCCVISNAESESAHVAGHSSTEPTDKLCFAAEHVRKHQFRR